MMTRVSLKDIAQEIGVSNATVSLVLNGKEKEGRVSKELAERIRKKAVAMNYHPNAMARALRMGSSNTIGLIVTDSSNQFFAKLAFRIEEYADSLGYSVIVANSNENDAKMERMIQELKNRQVDGFIIIPTENGQGSINNLVNSKVPVVLLDRYFEEINTHHVLIDNFKTSRSATEFLINQGCKRIGLIIYKSELPHMQERRNGFAEALKRNGMYVPAFIKEINYQTIEENIQKAIDDLLTRIDPVDGILFASNSIAIHSLKYLMKRNINIPSDMKVIGFDENDAFDLSREPIPFVQQPIAEMGKLSVDLIIKQIEKEALNPTHIELLADLQNLPN
ncbi:MAG: LacI family transcriptional regulator [Dysgonamonadaceae bacterium]|jgi:LacI family transcriptional regulator|nr:LacI family transcriptional regulator [Dysgonamonadaceae bacterium]